jgi:hypothetical protein
MKAMTKFLKTTLVGGLLVVLPVWLSLLLLLKAISGALKLLQPIVKMVPQQLVHPDMVRSACWLQFVSPSGCSFGHDLVNRSAIGSMSASSDASRVFGLFAE